VSCSTADGSPRFFLPSHLRVLHVSSALFYTGSLLGNLTFGVKEGDPDAEVGRVFEICKKLGVGAEALSHLSDVDDHHNWEAVFSASQNQLLMIARALITTPEILCIHNPVASLDEETAERVGNVLKDFVECRGLLQRGPGRRRRPRTCIMTTMDWGQLHLADQVFHISSKEGIKEVNLESIDSVRMTIHEDNVELRPKSPTRNATMK